MPTINIISGNVRGVDARVDPLTLGSRKLAWSVNMSFEEGNFKTRPGFIYQSLGIAGQFQGVCLFRPSLGLSLLSFGHCGAQLATAVDGEVYLNNATSSTVSPCAVKLNGTGKATECGVDRNLFGDVNLYQAENYLIVQNRSGPTYWWDGNATLTLSPSPGMTPDVDQGEEDHSHDTFITENHRNWLINGAGLGVYAHGRVHQEGRWSIFVSDIIHKRGHKSTDDLLLMEEQSLASHGPPLSTNSKMGRLMALEMSPQMGTANGEGELVGYYEGGVVTYNTFESPRETRYDPDKGQFITQGWDTKRLVSHRLDTISAVGRYAVACLPRDQFFRSPFGIHILSQVIGVETINDEPTNSYAEDIKPALDAESSDALCGSACGYWLRGQRFFTTIGLGFSEIHSTSPSGTGFVSWNKSYSKSEDRTPIAVWEGVWTVDREFQGIHRFTHIGLRADEGAFGFVGSDSHKAIYFASLTPDATEDQRDGKSIPISWAFETGQFDLGKKSDMKEIGDARLEGIFVSPSSKVRVLVRTDRQGKWKQWREFSPCDRKLAAGELLLKAEALGKPPEGYREAVWFEFRVEGTGWAQINSFDVDFTLGKLSSGNSFCTVLSSRRKNYLATTVSE